MDLFPDTAPVQGETLVSRTTPWEIRVYNEEVGQELRAFGNLRQWVVRESETGYLSFHYDVDYGGDNWNVVDAEGTAASRRGRSRRRQPVATPPVRPRVRTAPDVCGTCGVLPCT